MQSMYRFLSVTVALALAGCGDPGGASGDELADDEIEIVTEFVIGGVLGDQLFNAVFDDGPMASPPIRQTTSETFTVACGTDGAGETTLTVSTEVLIDDETGDGTAALAIISRPRSCLFETNAGVRYVITGDPDIRLEADLNLDAGYPSGTQVFEYSGRFRWEASGGRSGSCGIDVVIEISTASVIAEGRVCGRNYDTEMNLRP